MRAGKKALYLAAAGVLGLFCLMACGSFHKGGSAEAPEEINLRESGGQEEVKKALSAAGIPDADSREFFREVERFNTAVGDASTEDEMADRWEKAYPDFIGTNCRITAFMLARSLVKVGGGEAASEASEDNLSFDLEAIKSAPEALWDSGENDAFTRLFAEVAAADSTDTAVQCEQVQKAWRERGLSFSAERQALSRYGFIRSLSRRTIFSFRGMWASYSRKGAKNFFLSRSSPFKSSTERCALRTARDLMPT